MVSDRRDSFDSFRRRNFLSGNVYEVAEKIMEIAILVFFIAIFGGVLFLLGLIWFIFRRVRKSRSGSRNFSGNSNYGSDYNGAHQNFMDSDDSTAIYAGSSLITNQEPVSAVVVTETAHDSPYQSDNTYSHESHGASAAPMETSYTESSYSSSDSSSSSDSGSSSSDSGSSSSSSD
jgi:hypothetical protein